LEADEARKVANLTLHFYDEDKSPPNRQMLLDIYRMADFVDSMLRRSMEAFKEFASDRVGAAG